MQFKTIIGYHCCERSLGVRIANSETTLKVGSNKFDWLGSGVYFWVGNYQMARWWSNVKHEEASADFVGSTLKFEIDTGNCLDLTDAANLIRIRDFVSLVGIESFRDASGALLRNEIAPDGHRIEGEYKQRHLDHFIIDTYCDYVSLMEDMAYDTVFGVFESGPPVCEGSAIYLYDNIQLAVRESGLKKMKFLDTDNP
jgi:hypothetical protein